MSDDRRVDELSLEELEAIVEERRQLERARELAARAPEARFHPIVGQVKRPARSRRGVLRPRDWRDRLLLAVEVAAVLGLVAIIVVSLGTLQTLNREAAQVQRNAETPSPAGPTAVAGVLPGSSYPPSDSGSNVLPGSSSPPAALPAALGVNVEPAPALPPPTPGPQSPTRIVISKIGVDWPIVEGDGWEELKRGVGHHPNSANPGERGNMVLTGHDDVFGEVFKDLDQLTNGDEVMVYAGSHAYRYEVRAKRVVPPTELSVLAPTREPVVTLVTCTPYRVDTMRLIVIGQLVP